MAAIRASLSRNRSSSVGVAPDVSARATSSALAARMSARCCSSRSAARRSVVSLTAPDAVASARLAAWARRPRSATEVGAMTQATSATAHPWSTTAGPARRADPVVR